MIDLQRYVIANAYGLEPQLNVLQEECAELIQAISKYRRDGITLASVPSGLIEEIADVEIMLGQMRILLGEHVDREIDNRKDEKIRRQIHRIQSEDNENETSEPI